MESATLVGNTAGLEGVYRGVTNEYGFHEYFYDGANRRRVKVYSSGERDEYFFKEGGTELLTDIGNDSVARSLSHPIDDYVWLDGKPVVIVRGRLNTARERLADSEEENCGRNGADTSLTGVKTGTTCGLYYPVTEPNGRLAVMLDGDGLIAGVGEAEAGGSVNQVPVLLSTGQPYTSGNATLLNFAHQPWGKGEMEVRTRLHFFGVDLRGQDDVTLAGDGHSTSAKARCPQGRQCNRTLGRVTTDWVMSANEGYDLLPIEMTSLEPGVLVGRYGAVVDYVEYLRSEHGAKAWWPPLRLPGQYFDAETGLHENWNRFYDPATGQYLQPEPMLSDPRFIRRMAQQGHGVPAYAYAMNNPLYFTDPNGLYPFPWQPGKLCVSSSCKKDDGNSCKDLPETSPKAGDPGELKNLPAPGTCTDSDAVYMDTGVYKIPNNCKCTVECDSNGVEGLSCTCWPWWLGSPTHYPPGTNPPTGWPPNTSTP